MSDAGDLRCILVGTGGFGRLWWDLNRAALGARIVALVDVEPEPLSRAGTELALYPSDHFTSLQEAVSVVEADAVIDSTPPAFHLAHARTAFEHGLHLFTAKPMADTWSDAVQMVQAAEDAGLILVVNEQLRFGWLPLALRNVLESGEIGDVEAVSVRFREPSNWQGWRAAMPHPLLLDAAIQHFDMVRAVTSLEVQSAYCQAWRRSCSTLSGAGSAAALMKLSGGIPFFFEGTWDLPRQANDGTGWWGEWRLQGARGEVRAEGNRGLWINGVPSPAAAEALDVKRLSHVVFDQFVRSIRIGAPAPTDGWSDLHSLAMAELCIRSADTGEIVRSDSLQPPPPGASALAGGSAASAEEAPGEDLTGGAADAPEAFKETSAESPQGIPQEEILQEDSQPPASPGKTDAQGTSTAG